MNFSTRQPLVITCMKYFSKRADADANETHLLGRSSMPRRTQPSAGQLRACRLPRAHPLPAVEQNAKPHPPAAWLHMLSQLCSSCRSGLCPRLSPRPHSRRQRNCLPCHSTDTRFASSMSCSPIRTAASGGQRSNRTPNSSPPRRPSVSRERITVPNC